MAKKLTSKQEMFISEYLCDFNATQAAIRAGYSVKTAYSIGQELLKKPEISAEIRRRIDEKSMSADELLVRLGDQARADLGVFFKISERWTETPLPAEEILQEEEIVKTVGKKQVTCKRYLVRKVVIDMERVVDPRYSPLLQEFTDSARDGLGIKITNKLAALQTLAKVHRLDSSDSDATSSEAGASFSLPADVIAPGFLSAYRDIRDHKHTEYLFFGGRGSTKSSFISLATIYLLMNAPGVHALAARQVKDTLRDSVYSQLVWAINELGLEDQFKCTTSPLEITYLPTRQKIYFRGADDPGKIKSIKPAFGYIGILWMEELDQFHGEEAVRKIEQSVIRGGDLAYIFKSFNPPRQAANWANKYAKIPKATQYQHHSNYLDVPVEWLGRTFLEEADHLRIVNPKAYEHEYLGQPNGTGGAVFANVQFRRITDVEIAQFDHVLHGLDWGFYPDPAAYARMHYDAARMTLYIFGEYRTNKASNRALFDALVERGLTPGDLLIADSAEPKSVADFREYGATCRGAEKGPESVKYSMKWLQSLTAIVIDNERCPETAQEFMDYELEQDKDGGFISAYPDRNNHSIDAVRYATNLIWRKRGQ